MEDRVKEAFEGKNRKLSKLSITQIVFAVIFVLTIGAGFLSIYLVVDNTKNVFEAIFAILYIPLLVIGVLGAILLFEVIATIIQIARHNKKKRALKEELDKENE